MTDKDVIAANDFFISAKDLSGEHLTLRHVSIADESGGMLLNDISAVFPGGTITLLVGRNGAGKSTLLESLAGLRELAAGDIWHGQDSLWKGKRRQRLNADVLLKLGISMQQSQSQWFKPTAYGEIAYGLTPYSVSRDKHGDLITSAAEAAGFPHDLLERDPWSLSGGQQRRLALACLLVSNPAWLLLDEPTAGLDEKGKKQLAEVLSLHKAKGGGAIIATHEPEALFELADQALVLDGGMLRTAEAHELPRREEPAVMAERLAAAWRNKEQKSHEGHIANMDSDSYPQIQTGGEAAHIKRNSSNEAAEALEHRRHTVQSAPVRQGAKWLHPHTFDPRVLMAAYLMITACMLTQGTWPGIAASGIVTLALAGPCWPLFKHWLPVIRGVAILSALLVAIAGLRFGPLTFDWSGAEATAIRLSQLFLMMVLGMPMLGLVTPFRLQRALDQTFGWLMKFGVPVSSFTMLVSLIFRFIPLLMEEWGRFRRVSKARGKVASKGLPLSQLKVMLIPYMRSILRLAENMADALEARGFGIQREKPVYGFRLRPGRSDILLLLAASCSCAVLLWMN
ncbi:ATP-binding cassette domain-containing protein [Paenibacillus sp. CAU 1782]